MDLAKTESRIYNVMERADKMVSAFKLDRKLLELVRLRVSQINGCGYCVNLHAKDARNTGETEQRVFAVSAWWETPFFTEAERAAFKLAEEVTAIANCDLFGKHVSKSAQTF